MNNPMSKLIDIEYWNPVGQYWQFMLTCAERDVNDRIREAIKSARETGNYDINNSDFRTMKARQI